MLSASLSKCSACELTFKSCFYACTTFWWQCFHEGLHVCCFWSPSVPLSLAGLGWAPLRFTPKDQEKWGKMRWLVWTCSSAEGRKDASGKWLGMFPPKSNWVWQNGQADHGLLSSVGLTALVLAKQNDRKQSCKGSDNNLSTPFPHGTVYSLSSQPLTMEMSLPSQATSSTALSAITIRKFCPNDRT